MAIKHGASHGLATLLSIVVGGILVSIFEEHIPVLYDIFRGLAIFFQKLIYTLFKKEVSIDNINVILIAVILSTIWGVLFKYLHSDKSSKPSKKNG